MCGICGTLDFSGVICEDTVLKMTKAVEHRGPDHIGIYASEPISLGHARLSIIDLSEYGNQPMHSIDGRYTLVYNGETYNFKELRKVLTENGVAFRGNSDTEVVLNAFSVWGENAFAKLKGMFAFALWDNHLETLYLVRDHFGIKPLYYSLFDNGAVFGSEIKSILISEKIPRQFNLGALHEFLYYGATLGSQTLFEGIERVLPGHYLKINRDGCVARNYSRKYQVNSHHEDQNDAIQKVRHHMESAVKSHLVSDVPVGIFLSGGIDSSTITAYASKHYGGKIKTFSVGFDYSRGVNDLERAQLVAKHFDTEHHEIHISGNDVTDVIESLIECHDEPFSDAANIPLYMLCRELKGDIKVVLQGDGGDEIFAGYRRYNVLSIERTWRLLACLGSIPANMWPKTPRMDRYYRFLQALNNHEAYKRVALLLTEESLQRPPTRILSGETKAAVSRNNPFRRYEEIFEHYKQLDPVQRMLHIDCNIILPDIFLEKVDKSTMAHGIEIRVPMLDHDLASYVMGLPSSFKVKRGQKKWLLRKAMRGTVPDTILDSPKTGFSVPCSKWLAGPLLGYLKSVLLDKSTTSWGLFDEDSLTRCIEEHTSQKRNNGFLLYKLLNFCLWYKKYFC